eukprot:TRINITY_DN4179_c0_g3_i1.p1 TRINITY_DN4179_c0_g3~~TRINITY_DN4179_c0_g3_i1.p1  ORF type:complete len:388 (-),score=45.94 TRINITY_DN4179_c0_g3_i1:70-1233(-)
MEENVKESFREALKGRDPTKLRTLFQKHTVHPETINRLLQLLSDGNIKDFDNPEGDFQKNFLPCLQIFLENKADVNALVIDGKSWVARMRYKRTIKYLLNQQLTSADSILASIDGVSYPFLHYNIFRHWLDGPSLLSKSDLQRNINKPCTNGKTPLHLVFSGPAGQYSLADCFMFLITNGANPWIKDNNGKTPLDLMEEYNKDPKVNSDIAAQCIGAFWGLLQEKSQFSALIEASHPAVADISLVVADSAENRTFQTNRALLAAHSKKFSAMFRAGMKESNASAIQLRTDSSSVGAFSKILDFFTRGVFETWLYTEEDYLAMLPLADEYLCEDLNRTTTSEDSGWRNGISSDLSCGCKRLSLAGTEGGLYQPHIIKLLPILFYARIS